MDFKREKWKHQGKCWYEGLAPLIIIITIRKAVMVPVFSPFPYIAVAALLILVSSSEM